MIFHSVCNSCLQSYEIRAEPADVSMLKELVREDLTADCPRLCGGRINLTNTPALEALSKDPRLRGPLPLSVPEFFRAVRGAGLPDEIPNSPELVVSLLRAHRVVDCSVQTEGKKVYLHEIHLDNGSIIHLAAGMRGAHVLKVTKKGT